MASILTRRNFLIGLGAAAAGGVIGQGLKTLKMRSGPDSPGEGREKMTLRTNPLNGDRVSLLGFGCMRFPMLPGAQSPTGPEVDEKTAEKLIDWAYERGVSYFDTAYPYHQGKSETVLGRALRKHPRDSFFLADKMPTFLNPDRTRAEEYFFVQLKRCQAEYFDYYLLHNIKTKEIYQEIYEKNGVLDFLLEQKKAGRIRNLGWSFHGDEAALNYLLNCGVKWDAVQVQLNYHDLLNRYVHSEAFLNQDMTWQPAQPAWILEQLNARGFPIIIMEPLLGGRLARLNRKAAAILQSQRPEMSLASWAFRYAAGLPNVLTVLSGMTLLEHVKDNLRTYSPCEPLSEPEAAVLKKALDVFLTQENIPSTSCGHCMPCPDDVNIPADYSHYNLCADEEYLPRGGRSEEYEKARRAYLTGYDRSVPELRQASHCTGCGACRPHCPQGIAIPEQLARLGRLAEDLRNEV
ncbi:MAG: aldo/keto reductase [Deltaproteobacteria bacterium]|jgi:predicted aldo/keto reductase-like oxidoreductase|nr:aldo/keto reductase [Deltaproteobacteria bacterium]